MSECRHEHAYAFVKGIWEDYLWNTRSAFHHYESAVYAADGHYDGRTASEWNRDQKRAYAAFESLGLLALEIMAGQVDDPVEWLTSLNDSELGGPDPVAAERLANYLKNPDPKLVAQARLVCDQECRDSNDSRLCTRPHGHDGKHVCTTTGCICMHDGEEDHKDRAEYHALRRLAHDPYCPVCSARMVIKARGDHRCAACKRLDRKRT